MYATFSDFLREIFGINIPLPIQTFGLMMGLAFAAAFITAVSELKRKEGLGLLHSTKIKVWINKKATSSETFLAVISWSFIGFKALEGVLNYQDLVNNPQEFILSMKGNVVGLILGAAYGYYTIFSANQKLKDKEPKDPLLGFMSAKQAEVNKASNNTIKLNELNCLNSSFYLN
jgi:prolipoprotein diacylglyceryltransferase